MGTGQDGIDGETIKIAAMETGPGPAAYNLPSTIGGMKANNPDWTKEVSPSYSFGQRLQNGNGGPNPGPAAFFPKTTNRGSVATSAYSMQSRRTTHFDVKGTIRHAPSRENFHSSSFSPGPMYDVSGKKTSTPAYSIGHKIEPLKRKKSPGPNSYNLPPTVGQDGKVTMKTAPAYSLSAPWRSTQKRNENPGPGTYTSTHPDVFKKKQPRFTLRGRCEFDPGLKERMKIPGPAQYDPEKANVVAKTPMYTLRSKHSIYALQPRS